MNTHQRPKKASPLKDWHPADIKAAVEKAGWTLRGLARHHGVYTSVITKALRQSYPKSERRIAEVIGIDPAEIWPSRYEKSNSRSRRANVKAESEA